MDLNPYAATTLDAPQATPVDGAEQLRREYINPETNIKTLGALFILGGFLLLLSLAGMIGGVSSSKQGTAMILMPGVVLTGVFGVAYLVTGFALRRFKTWARITAIVFCALGLLAFPVGTIISLIFLIILAGKKASIVFSPAYQSVIPLTPHVKVKSSKAVMIVLLTILLGLAGFIAYFVFVIRP